MTSLFVAVSSPLLSTRSRKIHNEGKKKNQAQTNNKIQTQHNSCKQDLHNFYAWSLKKGNKTQKKTPKTTALIIWNDLKGIRIRWRGKKTQ